MVKKSESELMILAAPIFEELEVEELIATTDGNIFTIQAISHARNHARSTGHALITLKKGGSKLYEPGQEATDQGSEEPGPEATDQGSEEPGQEATDQGSEESGPEDTDQGSEEPAPGAIASKAVGKATDNVAHGNKERKPYLRKPKSEKPKN